MRKIIFIVLMALEVNGYSQVKLNAGASWAAIGQNDYKFITGNGNFSFSAGVFHDFKLVNKVYFTPEILFTNNNVSYLQDIVLTDASGKPIFNYQPYSIKGVETPLQLKIKGDIAYASLGISPFVNTNKFDAFIIPSAGIYIQKFASMDIRYSYGLGQLDYGYQCQRLTVGLSFFIHN